MSPKKMSPNSARPLFLSTAKKQKSLNATEKDRFVNFVEVIKFVVLAHMLWTVIS